MKRSMLSLASILTLASVATVSAQDTPHSFSANLALTTD